jgi:hypothetical protein
LTKLLRTNNTCHIIHLRKYVNLEREKHRFKHGILMLHVGPQPSSAVLTLALQCAIFCTHFTEVQ